MERREEFVVSVVRPEGVTKSEMKEYIREAVKMWSKGTNPEFAMFEIGDKPVRVKPIKVFE